MAVSISMLLDTRRAKKGDCYPLKLRVIVDRKSEYYSTIYDLSLEDYKKFTAPRINDELQKVRTALQDAERNAILFAKESHPFNFKQFEKDFINQNVVFKKRKLEEESNLLSVNEFDITLYKKKFKILEEIHPDRYYISYTFYEYIIRLLQEGRIGTALSYSEAYSNLKKFRGNVRFADITMQYLHQYEQWLIHCKGTSKATVGITLRALRAMFNEAIENKLIKRDFYPFGRKRYRIPTAKKAKKSLTIEEVQKLYEYEPKKEHIQKAKALWFFCYFGNGMNPKDMAYLKFKNIEGEYLNFVRAKTERSLKDDPITITLYLSEEMRDIIKLWGNKDSHPDNYIFPVLESSENLLQQYTKVTTLSKFINDGMAEIARELDMPKKITNMVCRHTFSTIMKRSGASTEYIQEALGHADKRTTENYLDSFEKEVKKEFSSRLLSFKSSVKVEAV